MIIHRINNQRALQTMSDIMELVVCPLTSLGDDGLLQLDSGDDITRLRHMAMTALAK